MRYSFESFVVLDQERQLLVNGERASIGARAFDVLLALIEHRFRVLSKNELLDLVWPGLMVEENNLQVQISGLRKLLGPQSISTIPGRGYRFALPVRVDGASMAAGGNGTPVPAPQALATGSRGTNLPEVLRPLFGRAADIAAARDLLNAHRVVSIVATSGVGKTRLAQAVAGEVRSAYADGVWWVDLTALSDGEQVAAEVASVLGFQVASGRPALDTVVDVLRRQSLLLLLDNCEHLLEAVAVLVQAIAQFAPEVRVLLTSQEPLKIAGERVLRLDTLPLPASSGLADAQDSGAVQLLVHHIQAADPRFALTPTNVDKVVAICRRLDGIALALELAAARMPLLGLDGLLARLDERFQVLTGGPRFVPARHQTLRAAFDFSHGLLKPEEQIVLRRIGVFAGSFSVESAQDVAADADIDRWALLDHLGALVDKSIVLAESGEYPRLRLLETARAYALEKLDEAGEAMAMQERHARTLGKLSTEIFDAGWNMSDAALRTRYGLELDNLRAALGWALKHDAELAIALAGNVALLWRDAFSLQAEGARYCEAALKGVSASTSALAHGRLLHSLAWMLVWSHPRRAGDLAERAASLLRQTDDKFTLGSALMIRVPGATTPGPQQLAAVEELRRLSDPQAPGKARLILMSSEARLNMAARRYPEAMRIYVDARALADECGAAQWEAVMSCWVADIALTTGDLDLAVTTLIETSSRLEMQPTKGIFLPFALGSLVTAYLFKSNPVAARVALANATPLIVRYSVGYRYAATAALLAAMERRWSAAAQLLGYGESTAAGNYTARPVEIEAGQRASAYLTANAAKADIDAWKQAGTMLSTEAAYRLALATMEERSQVGSV